MFTFIPGIASLFAANGITLLSGHAQLVADKQVEVTYNSDKDKEDRSKALHELFVNVYKSEDVPETYMSIYSIS